MMRSMFSGVSGLRTHQTKMDVIANNISNVNTVGFKASRVTFKEVFTQTISGASAPSLETGRGGTNPMQIGLGVNIGSIDNLMTQGAAQRTDNTTDLMINGDNFFVVSDPNGTYFTRAGAFMLDMAGNLVMSGSGLNVNGWYSDPEVDAQGLPTGQYKIDQTVAQPITISGQYEYIMPEMTTAIRYDGNLNAVTRPIQVSKMSFFDSLGNRYDMDVEFSFSESGEEGPPAVAPASWKVSLGNLLYLNGDTTNPIELAGFAPPNADGGIGSGAPAVPSGSIRYDAIGYIKFNEFGQPDLLDEASLTSISMLIDTGDDPAGSEFIPNAIFNPSGINLNFSGLTQFSMTPDVGSTTLDGTNAGTLTGYSLDQNGVLTGQYSNGKIRPIAQLATAKFVNPAGLEKIGNNLYSVTNNSGEFNGIGEPISQSGGSFIVGSLEMANVDLSSEFTEMITTQRGFQANSKIITTSDELLQELVNLKR